MLSDEFKYKELVEDRISKVTAKGSLDWSPKENWVDEQGGLPKYIEEIALALIRERGMNRSRAIATAISRVKVWAAGGAAFGHTGSRVNPDTQAKALAALAQWEAMKARAKADNK